MRPYHAISVRRLSDQPQPHIYSAGHLNCRVVDFSTGKQVQTAEVHKPFSRQGRIFESSVIEAAAVNIGLSLPAQCPQFVANTVVAHCYILIAVRQSAYSTVARQTAYPVSGHIHFAVFSDGKCVGSVDSACKQGPQACCLAAKAYTGTVDCMAAADCKPRSTEIPSLFRPAPPGYRHNLTSGIGCGYDIKRPPYSGISYRIAEFNTFFSCSNGHRRRAFGQRNRLHRWVDVHCKPTRGFGA